MTAARRQEILSPGNKTAALFIQHPITMKRLFTTLFSLAIFLVANGQATTDFADSIR